MKWGVRPVCRSTTGQCGERDAALRGHRRPPCGKLRPNRVTVAPQACGMAGAKGTPRPRCPRGRSGKRFGRCECVPLGRPSGERNAQSLRSVPLGGCSESAVLNPMQPVPDSGDREPSRFLGGKQLEKPETDSIIAERPCERKGFGVSPPKVFGIVSRNPKPAP